MTTCGIFGVSWIVFGQFGVLLETLGRRIVLSILEDGHHEPRRPSVGTLKKTGEEQWKGQMFDLSNRVSVKILTRLSVTKMATFRTSVDQQPWPPPSPASRFPGHIGFLGSLGPLWPFWGSLRRLLGRCWGPLGPLRLSWAVLGSVCSSCSSVPPPAPPAPCACAPPAPPRLPPSFPRLALWALPARGRRQKQSKRPTKKCGPDKMARKK